MHFESLANKTELAQHRKYILVLNLKLISLKFGYTDLTEGHTL